MARKEKILEEISCTYNEVDIDRREVGYYATPEFISNYISLRMLQINNSGTRVLDPCCGKEELLSFFFNKGLHIDGMDIIRYKDKYNCNFKNIDFINYYCNKKDSSISGLNLNNRLLELDYDYYIANPPYNCHEVDFIKNNKGKLKKYFSDVGVHNMYSMFISAIIDLAKQDAVIGLIAHDSFLTSKYHKGLRRKILSECTVHEVTMCPTDLFLRQGADVRTSIIILQKGKKHQGEVIVNNRSLNTQKLKEVLDKNINQQYMKKYSLDDIILNNENDNAEFIIECPDDIKSLFYEKRLGQILKCVTGISTGNDKLYLSEKMEGPFTVPFYKNPGKDRFYTNKHIYLHEDFLKFNKEIKSFMVRNKSLLFKAGITCSSMGVEFTASKLPSNSTFGVNANIICDEYDSW